MELKKSPKADLEGKKALFFEIGLAASLLLMIVVFSWSQKEVVVEIPEIEAPIVEVEMVEITKPEEELPKPPSPKQSMNVQADVLNLVDDNELVELDLSTVEFEDDIESIFSGVPNTEGSDGVGWNPNEIFYAVEDMPTFQGGDRNTFAAWLQRTVDYPTRAQNARIQGSVILQVQIKADGTIGEINVLASPSQLLSDAAIAQVKKSPKWGPGMQQGTPVSVWITIPVEFVLDQR